MFEASAAAGLSTEPVCQATGRRDWARPGGLTARLPALGTAARPPQDRGLATRCSEGPGCLLVPPRGQVGASPAAGWVSFFLFVCPWPGRGPPAGAQGTQSLKQQPGDFPGPWSPQPVPPPCSGGFGPLRGSLGQWTSLHGAAEPPPPPPRRRLPAWACPTSPTRPCGPRDSLEQAGGRASQGPGACRARGPFLHVAPGNAASPAPAGNPACCPGLSPPGVPEPLPALCDAAPTGPCLPACPPAPEGGHWPLFCCLTQSLAAGGRGRGGWASGWPGAPRPPTPLWGLPAPQAGQTLHCPGPAWPPWARGCPSASLTCRVASSGARTLGKGNQSQGERDPPPGREQTPQEQALGSASPSPRPESGSGRLRCPELPLREVASPLHTFLLSLPPSLPLSPHLPLPPPTPLHGPLPWVPLVGRAALGHLWGNQGSREGTGLLRVTEQIGRRAAAKPGLPPGLVCSIRRLGTGVCSPRARAQESPAGGGSGAGEGSVLWGRGAGRGAARGRLQIKGLIVGSDRAIPIVFPAGLAGCFPRNMSSFSECSDLLAQCL